MESQDKEALDGVLDDLIDTVVKFKGNNKHSENDLVELMYSLDYGKFILSGIIYSNGICICGTCDDDGIHDDEEE